jgi:hypothetical protein
MAYYKSQFKNIRSIKDIDKLSGEDFEWFCKFLLEDHLGFERVRVTKKEIKGSTVKYDGGIDIIAHKNNETYLIQCKRWSQFGKDKRKRILPVHLVREHGGVMKEWEIKHSKYPRGMIIATVPACVIARREAKTLNIELMDYSVIMRLVLKFILNN